MKDLTEQEATRRPAVLVNDLTTEERLDLRRLVWLEYLVLTERYDRTLPGRFGRDPDAWMPAPGPAFHASVTFSRYCHGRAREAVLALVGRHGDLRVDASIVEAHMSVSHAARERVLDGRTPTADLLGPAFFSGPARL